MPLQNLRNFLSEHRIDMEQLGRIKHRLYIVGRFNRKPIDSDKRPEVYLFSNRPDSDFSETYLKKLFDSKYKLNFDNFVKALRPSIAEKIDTQYRIPAVIQHMPAPGEDEASITGGAVVIDTWNYFFWRAAARSEQGAFMPQAGSMAEDLLNARDGEHGKSIYKQIRRNLRTLCVFQPRTGQLVEAFSSLLESAALFNGLPPYASGGSLPPGFLEKLIDFVYCPDLNADFDAEGVDFSAPVWEKFRNSQSARDTLERLVNTFRNALVDAPDQHIDLRIAGGVTAYQQSGRLLAKRTGLVTDFNRARDAYNSLNQIVRSKVLLSMVLEWVFNAHYDLDPVLKCEDQEDRDQMVSDLILGRVNHSGVAAPIRRATTEERDRFRNELASNFDKVIVALVAREDNLPAALDALPKELRDLAIGFRNDSELKQMVERMALGAGGDPRPFIDSQKAVLIDVLMPVLYQAPTLDLYDLRMMFRREVQAAYLTAITLDDKYQGAVREVAENYLPTFLKNIDLETRRINDSMTMQNDLLKAYITRIANKDLAERVVEAQEMIKRAMTVIEKTVLEPGEVRGASHMAPVFDGKVGASRRTRPGRRNVRAVGKLAEDTANAAFDAVRKQQSAEKAQESDQEKVTVAAGGQARSAAMAARNAVPSMEAPVVTASASASDAFAAGGSSEATGDPATGNDVVDGPARPEPEELRDDLKLDVKAMVSSFLSSRDLEHVRKEEIAPEIRKIAESDPELERKATDAVRVYNQILSLIYERYRENEGKQAYIGRVERMTMANLMLANQESLGLGKACSNLYAMLLDVVEKMDPETPNPHAFIRDFSLTRYFDNDVLDKGKDERNGVTELRQVLRLQTQESMTATVNFISELRGVKYLMDTVRDDSEAEIVVVNASAGEFLKWIERDNLGAQQAGRLTMQSAFLEGAAEPTAAPGLIYMTDSAFANQGTSNEAKKAWLGQLRSMRLRNQQLRLVLPPICLSTGVDEAGWDVTGKELAAIASAPGENAIQAPVTIIGPSPFLNVKDDAFKTYLPAGYIFAAHFLSQPEQAVRNVAVVAADSGRFRVIGAGIGTMRDTLDTTFWGSGPEGEHAFAADFYLFILLTILATAENNIRGERPQADKFFPCFTGRGEPGDNAITFNSSSALNDVLIGSARSFSLARKLENGKFTAINLEPPGGGAQVTRDIHWFNRVLAAADLPKYAEDRNEI